MIRAIVAQATDIVVLVTWLGTLCATVGVAVLSSQVILHWCRHRKENETPFAGYMLMLVAVNGGAALAMLAETWLLRTIFQVV